MTGRQPSVVEAASAFVDSVVDAGVLFAVQDENMVAANNVNSKAIDSFFIYDKPP